MVFRELSRLSPQQWLSLPAPDPPAPARTPAAGRGVPVTGPARQSPARLVTAGPHPHPLAGECPLACLAGLVSAHTLGAVTHAMTATWPERGRDHHIIADLAAITADGRLARARNIGPAKITELRRVLCAAGLISQGRWAAAAPVTARTAGEPDWLPPDGPLIRELRTLRGSSQATLARNAGVVTSTITRIETSPSPYCRVRTLANIAAVLEHTPESLTRQAGMPGQEHQR